MDREEGHWLEAFPENNRRMSLDDCDEERQTNYQFWQLDRHGRARYSAG
jgi:hypothetical protein